MRLVPIVATLCLAVSCGGAATAPVEPSQSAPIQAGATPEDRTIDKERTANRGAFGFIYLPEQKRLTAEHPGEWLAIVDGQIVPTAAGKPAPVKTLAAAEAAARLAAPFAKHRFLFAIGEEGDVDWPMAGCDAKHVVGTRLLLALQDMDAATWSKTPNPLVAILGGKVKPLLTPGKDARQYVRPEIGPMDYVGEARECCVSTGFPGTAVVPPESARGLELWEIPGVAKLGPSPEAACRRAYARFRWPSAKLDATLPVAVWPK